uniref:PDZ domain-containing protein n=1 Tax=Panagrellus redivivus TaxID=6233 RepID=A0A7E4VDU6_PANRE
MVKSKECTKETTQDQTVEEEQPHGTPKKTPYQKLPDKITQKVTINIVAANPRAKLGIRVGRTLNICSVQTGSPVEGQLKPGDMILSLNDQKIKERQQFEDILGKVADGKYTFVVRRPKPPETLEKESEILKTLPKAYDQVPGCKYIIGYLCIYPGASLGVHIMSLDSKVYVTNAPPHSLAGEVFSMGDAVLAIDGVPVTTVKMCSSAIKDALYAKGYCKTLLERPTTPVAKRRAKAALKTEKSMEIDPKMAEDIQGICFNVIEELIKEKDITPPSPRGMLKLTVPKADTPKKVSISETSEEAGIGCDPFNPELLQNVEPTGGGDKGRPQRKTRSSGDKKDDKKAKSGDKKDGIATTFKKKLRGKLKGKGSEETLGTVEETTKEE